MRTPVSAIPLRKWLVVEFEIRWKSQVSSKSSAGFAGTRKKVSEMSVRQMVGRRLSGFRKDEDGAVSVEFVLWLPVFLAVMVLIVDTTLVYSAEARLWDAARDATRQLSLYQLSEDEVEDYVRENAIGLNGTLTVTASDTGPDVWVQITMPMSDVAVFDVFNLLENPIIAARVTQRAEPI